MYIYDTPLNTTLDTVGFVYAASYRGTSDIIFSCFLTMGLCVWSALHLNIPACDESRARQWIRNTGWVALGIFGPELIMFAAFKNWASAKALQNLVTVEKKCDSCGHITSGMVGKGSGSITKENGLPELSSIESTEWTLVHGYYATMGGFVFDLDNESASNTRNSRGNGTLRWTITPQGIQLLIECGLIPHIETREILDKNKSDSLAKAIVILQAGWLVVSSIARLAYGLPVTLLEINTIGHVICAIFIYGMWWNKPRDITEPTILRGTWVAPMASYMMMSSDSEASDGWREWASLKPPIIPEFSHVELKLEADGIDTPRESANPGISASSSISQHSVSDNPECVVKAGFGQLILVKSGDAQLTGMQRQKPLHRQPRQSKTEDQLQRTRWKLALDAMQQYPHLQCRLDQLKKCLTDSASTYQPQVMLQKRSSNWPTKGSIPPYKGMLVGMALWFASIAFGAVHVAAWNEYFPTSIERWLWRSSALYLAWAGSLWLSICFLGYTSKRFLGLWDLCISGRAHTAAYVFLLPTCGVCGFVYAFARVYLVVESVASLRKMPPQVYWTPNWPQVIPHL